MERQLYRPREVAEILGLSRGEVYALCQRGVIASVHIGKNVRISSTELERLMTVGAPNAPEVLAE